MVGKAQLDVILAEAVGQGASDVHLTVGLPPVFRIHGKLVNDGEVVCTSEQTEWMAKEMMGTEEWDAFIQTGDADFAYELQDASRFRVNVFKHRSGIAMAFRLIGKHIPSLDELKMPRVLKEVANQPQGLVLVTGPTGSGKSTTLASMISYINATARKHIITLEDPIEYMHEHNQSIIDQREVGTDTDKFATGLRAALRQDPDVILVGEMRDLETISTAITAAETGHLVLGTLHTSSAPATIERIIDVFPPAQQAQVRYQLSTVLLSIVSQRLFPLYLASGRVAATEILVNNTAVSNLIRNEKIHQIPGLMQTSRDQGMYTLEMSIRDLLQQNMISYEDARTYMKGIANATV
ncbi:type IV pilus twitching motility protein PilT [Priestia taiwanensis]|uniref:Twitching motility protein PilT n=1 Tax=Priestia taiwanensis TaxID=1347902 RepID=A0A917ERG5_9BACI|nr:type IV pilus twitching motility protein PilT [Priestia taiwanensis]MBM7363594.1 twitching motility protein PilT [Priestia taiwanensis]GGE75786.1 twitching motility protein PilT [Priestia taiwanensis]